MTTKQYRIISLIYSNNDCIEKEIAVCSASEVRPILIKNGALLMHGPLVTIDLLTGDRLSWEEVFASEKFKADSNAHSQLYYLDPVHIGTAASHLGRLGGQAKSEAKKLSSRENGKKGGRPKKSREGEEREANKNKLNLHLLEE